MGGALFNNVLLNIQKEIAEHLQSAIIQEILDIYPNLKIVPIGSVGKKEFNSDIDIAIVVKDIKQLEKIITTVFDYTESITVESIYVISIKYPFEINDELNYVQVDFINVWDIDYTKFRYYCPNYLKNESKYKVGQKIMFANMVINHCLDLRQKNLQKNEFGIFLFEPIGLLRNIVNIDSNILTQEFVTKNPQEIAGMCFYDSNINHFNSIETLWDAIHSDNYKYPSEVKKLEKNFFINCWKKGWTNIVPENFEMQHWTNEEIWNFLNEENKIHKLNSIFAKLAGMENK